MNFEQRDRGWRRRWKSLRRVSDKVQKLESTNEMERQNDRDIEQGRADKQVLSYTLW